ncbi:hypothetical protein AADZ84_12660 [Colwelliaceae bacterium MEBiC 14330]
MAHQQLIKRSTVLISMVLVTWFLWPSSPAEVTVSVASEKQAIKQPIEHKFLQTLTPKVTKNHTKINAEKISSNKSAALVAKVYAAELNFPPYSQPLTSHDFDRLQPNHFNPQSIPVDDEGKQISATLSKYRYTYPEPILATMRGENIINATLELIDTSSGKVLLTSVFEQEENNWYAQLDGKQDLPEQLHATVRANVNSKTITMALALKYIDSIATLEGFGSTYSRDADMMIPVKLTTRKKGLYRVRANLFDANNQPIAHLVTKEKLAKGRTKMNLKAHQSVLQGKQAPFYLATFSIELMSPAPGQPTKYGNSLIKKHEIKDFAVSSLSNTPYQPSEQEQQRLKLLQQMSQD